MAAGIKVFRDHFKDFSDQYVVIGGMACDLLLNDAGLDFRITKDIDMVLIVEAMTENLLQHSGNSSIPEDIKRDSAAPANMNFTGS